jgi:CoA:oxalate CoA-transferase
MTGGRTNPKVGTRSSLLAGVKVLDLTNSLAGPFGTTVLADMGADVVKLEPPQGDRTRQTPPYFVGQDSAYFVSLNRNKRSIAMDLKTAEGQRVLEKLLLWADVVVDNLRQQKREDVGLGFERISAINPALVSCSVTGFGSEGPYSDRPAYDIVVEALAGVMSLTGPEGGPSVRAGVPIGDIVAGLYWRR